MTALPLSVLDLVPLAGGSGPALRHSLELAAHVDALGYTRLWYAEHHNLPTVASTTPEILIALAAERTGRLRVGSGGVMLPNHMPLKVAETFKLLGALYPGRIDLGIGRAPGTDPATARALRGGRVSGGADAFPAQLAELRAFGEPVPDGAFPKIAAVPEDTALPPIWLLGSGDFSARLAAAQGLGFAFAAHFSDLPAELPIGIYRAGFVPGPDRERPHVILTVSALCAPTDDEARYLLSSHVVAFTRLRTGQEAVLLPPDEASRYVFSEVERPVADHLRAHPLVGSPDVVAGRIRALAERAQADEVMVTTFTHGAAERLHSYTLLAQAMGLTRRDEDFSTMP
jgi:luciferase family oxidoreductase group 1